MALFQPLDFLQGYTRYSWQIREYKAAREDQLPVIQHMFALPDAQPSPPVRSEWYVCHGQCP